MSRLSRLRIATITGAAIAGIGSIVAPRVGQPQVAPALLSVGLVFFVFWFVLFVRSRIPR